MNTARIVSTNEIVSASNLLELYPNYAELEFVCIDENVLSGWLPLVLKKKIVGNRILRNIEIGNISKLVNTPR